MSRPARRLPRYHSEVPSLQKLSGSRILAALGQNRKMAEALAFQAPEHQEIIFRVMKGEVQRLQEIDRENELFQRYSYSTDLHVMRYANVRLHDGKDDWVYPFAEKMRNLWEYTTKYPGK
jgi:hypothetical protein